MRVITLLLAFLISSSCWAIKSSEYLPEDADLNPAIPTPESVLGFDVGEWRVSHDQLVKYMEILAASSDRVSIKITGYSHEHRPLLQLTITSAENQEQVESLRQQHLRSAFESIDQESPLVIWLGHSIHGNEESGSNSSLLSAYYLAASRSGFVTNLLNESIILHDPSFNPDGFNRFASWSNSNRSKNPNSDWNHRINSEVWPSARTNHYLFDMNRDWLPLVHPESQARIAEFHRWLPHVLTDQHERAKDGYFFQPGVPSRQNPLTPIENLQMTRALAQYHAKAMDEAGVPYFTEDDYDDFYYGKGSTYPDINGSIGILFEQPSIKGPVLERDTGIFTFKDAIKNQLRTTLSTLHGSYEIQGELRLYQRGFFESTYNRARESGNAAWVVGDDGDAARAAAFLNLLDQHQIEYSSLAQDMRAGSQEFKAGRAWVIPVQQRQAGMVEAIMEVRTEFEDDYFYDVSAWTQPLAYNLPYAQVTRMPQTMAASSSLPGPAPEQDAVAWVVPWNQLEAAALLHELLEAGALVRAATKPFTARSNNGSREFTRGDLVIHSGLQASDKLDAVHSMLSNSVSSGMTVASVTSMLTPSGPDLGAPHFKRIKPIKVIMITGQGVSEQDAGHAWHHMDQYLGFAPTMVDMDRLNRVSLPGYTHLVMVDGSYSRLSGSLQSRIGQWVKEGGILITSARASTWAESLCFSGSADDCKKVVDEDDEAPVTDRPYADYKNDESQLVIGGAIAMTSIDVTHPIAFGFPRGSLPLFRRGTTLLAASKNAYSTPVRYVESPLIAGFIGTQRQAEMSNQAAVIAERQGAGLVVRFANNPVFRGFWRGSERLFNNALYMGQVIDNTNLLD
jgi:hypothetical protein